MAGLVIGCLRHSLLAMRLPVSVPLLSEYFLSPPLYAARVRLHDVVRDLSLRLLASVSRFVAPGSKWGPDGGISLNPPPIFCWLPSRLAVLYWGSAMATNADAAGYVVPTRIDVALGICSIEINKHQ
jgi:hypothetical protein